MARRNDGAGPLPSIHLQWFAEEGNPAGGSGEGAAGAGSAVTSLLGEAGSGEGQQKPPAQGEQKQEPEGQGQGTAKPATEQLPGWTQATTKELRADPRFSTFAAKFKSFDDAVKSAMELDSKIGGMVTLPTDKSTPEEVAAFYAKLDVPVDPKDYPLEMRKDLQYSDESLAEFRELASKAHLSKAQAKEIFNLVNERAKKTLDDLATQRAAARTQEKADCEATVKKEWGADYDANYEIARRGLQAFHTPQLLKDLEETGMGNKPSLMFLFRAIGETVKEDSASFRAGRGGAKKSLAEVMYPEQAKE